MPKLLIAESVDTKMLEDFENSENNSENNLDISYQPNITPQELEQEISDYDALIVRPKHVSAAAINNAKNLKLIVRGGAGVNSIALEAAKANDVIIANTPGLNSDATAEFTIALMLEAFCKRQLQKSNEKTWEGNPGEPDPYKGFELRGKKLGIIGLGNIGQRVAKIAEAFGMDVICYVRAKKDLPFKQTTNLSELLAMDNDIISLNIPLSEDTNGIINKNAFEQINKQVVIINTARPQLIDIDAFSQSLESGKLASYAIDGDYDQVEPFIKADSKQRGIITHHIADCTFESQAAITEQALKQVKAFFEDGEIINRVV